MKRTLFTLLAALLLQESAAADAKYTINIAIMTDWQTVESFGGPAATQAALQARVDTASQIYTDQMQLAINVSSWTIPTSAADDFPYTDTQSTTLLNHVATWRESSAAQCSQAVTVLMTTRVMTDDIIGTSFTGSACWADGAAIVETNFGDYNDGIILAHEIGHTLGANHDGDPTGSCGSTPQNVYIMTADSLENTTGQFSPCSVEMITAGFATHSCIQAIKVQAPPATAAATAVASPAKSTGGGGAFEWISILLLTVTLVTRLSCTKV